MFEEINKVKIRVNNFSDRTISYIPNVISIYPLDQLMKATEWLFSEAVQDHNNTHETIKERRKKHGISQQNLDDIRELSIRLGSRMQGYVNQLCLMEDILIYEYDRMSELVKEASGGKVVFDPKSDYEPLRKRLAPIRTFRNKVVAHTAYTYPKIDKKTGLSEDNPETVVRSILNLFPREDGIYLGATSFSGFSEYKSQLPVITIFSWEEETKLIFQDWKKLFIYRLKEIGKQCPFENKHFSIGVANPRLAKQLTD